MPENAERFAAMRATLSEADDAQVRRRYVRAFVGEVVTSRERIITHGPNRALESTGAGDISAADKVRSFMGVWCTRFESDGHSNHWEISVPRQD